MQRITKLLLVLAVVAAGCSGSEAAEPTTTTTTEATTTTTTTPAPTTTATTVIEPTTTSTTLEPAEVSPLNGLPVTDSEAADRRVLGVKIDNHCNARPQSGIQEADAVYELKVEGFFTRFVALFHDNDADYLGPIRSGRPTDPTLLRPLGATFAISGGQPWILDLIASRGVRMLGEGTGTFRIPSRSAPHNLYGDTTALQAEADRRGYANDPPPGLFAWGEFAGSEEATEVTLDWDTGNDVVWTWDGERYLRSLADGRAGCGDDGPHLWQDADGNTEEISAQTLVVLFTERYTARPPAGVSGSGVPASETVGEGRALVFAEGKVAEGTWSREAITDLFALSDEDGEVLAVPPGVPWISLFDAGRSVTWD